MTILEDLQARAAADAVKRTLLIMAIATTIEPLLARLDPEVEAAVLAHLTAIWLKEQPREGRTSKLAMHHAMVLHLADLEAGGRN
jgi:hypothetical protein